MRFVFEGVLRGLTFYQCRITGDGVFLVIFCDVGERRTCSIEQL